MFVVMTTTSKGEVKDMLDMTAIKNTFMCKMLSAEQYGPPTNSK
jgi:hypothetical protein